MPKTPGFISYSTTDRRAAAAVKASLAACGVDAFMAHEDIHISQQWRDRIVEELRRMEVFVPILSANFKASEWTAQETGAAVVRGDVLIMPVLLDATVPYGFLNHFQGRPLPSPIGADFFRTPLLAHRPSIVIDSMIDELDEGAGSYRGAEALMRPIVPFFPQLSPQQAERLVDISIGNNQIWDAGWCRGTYLPDLLAKTAGKIPPSKAHDLEELIA